jgi:signal transduction histidine kinase
METRLIGYDGVTRWIWTRAVARREGGRLLIDGICTDVTERHQLAQEREDLLARRKDQVRQLRELDRMKDELVALVTHELRSPVTSIRGYLELVLDQPEALNAQTLRFLSIVDRKAADLLQLTDDLLDLARLDAGHVTVELRPTSLTRLLHETVNGHLPAADAKHLLLDLRIADNLLVHADPGRLRQVLDNLLSNAVKYTPDGGRVTLTATADTATASVVIADTGIGIPAEEYPRLFERFFRTSNALREGIKGTGLGLSITKAIVEEHGGSITARANIPSGTVFTITLPANGLEPSPE